MAGGSWHTSTTQRDKKVGLANPALAGSIWDTHKQFSKDAIKYL